MFLTGRSYALPCRCSYFADIRVVIRAAQALPSSPAAGPLPAGTLEQSDPAFIADDTGQPVRIPPIDAVAVAPKGTLPAIATPRQR